MKVCGVQWNALARPLASSVVIVYIWYLGTRVG